MFSVENLKKTRFAQEIRQEGLEEGLERGLAQGQEQTKMQLVPRLSGRGMSPEEIAELLELDPPRVQKILQSPAN